MDITPASMTSVTFTLLDALLTQLIDKGVLTKEDQVAIFESARLSLSTAQDPQMRDAAALLDHLYKN